MNELSLRPLAMTDLERCWRWHNDPVLYATLAGTYRSVSLETETEWLRVKSQPSPREANMAICLNDGEHIGNAYLREIDPIARHGELHLFIGDAAQRGKGYGSQATRLLLEHARKVCHLQRVYLQVLATNHAARRVYAKCGFVEEGCLRRHAFKQGAFVDVIVMGWLADEPASLQEPSA